MQRLTALLLFSVLAFTALAAVNDQMGTLHGVPVPIPCPPPGAPVTPTCPKAEFTIPNTITCNQEFIATLDVQCGCDFELTNGDICQLVNGEPFGCYGCERQLVNNEIRSMKCVATSGGDWIILGAYLPDQIGCPVNKTFTVGCCQ